MSAGFGFSVGDFIRALELIAEVGKALRESRGAAHEYQQTIVELEGLGKALRYLESLQPSTSNAAHVNAVRGMAFACQLPLQEFLSKIHAYEASLGPLSRKNTIRGVSAKAKWALYMSKEVEKLRTVIAGKIISIQLLLSTNTSEALSRIEAVSSERYNNLLARIEEVRSRSGDQCHEDPLHVQGTSNGREESAQETFKFHNTADTLALRPKELSRQFHNADVEYHCLTQNLPALLAATQSMPASIHSLNLIKDHLSQQPAFRSSRNEDVGNSGIPNGVNVLETPVDVLELLDSIIQQNMELYKLLRQIQSAIPQTPTQLLPDNIIFEDVLGRVKSLPYTWFRHWEVFEGLLRAEFKHMPGEQKIEEGLYQVITTKRNSILVTSMNWGQSIFPSSKVSMSIIMAQLRMEAGMCPRGSCKGERTTTTSKDAFFVICFDCGLKYRSPTADDVASTSSSWTAGEKTRNDQKTKDGQDNYSTEGTSRGKSGPRDLITNRTKDTERKGLLEQERREIEHFRSVQIQLAEPPLEVFPEPAWDTYGKTLYIPRMGLSLQHYTSNGEIIVGGIVALSADKSRVLIIRSVRRNGWVLPKGRWRSPEKTPAEIAIRRAWDEAGLIVTVERYLGVVNQTTEATRPSSQETDSYCFYEMNVESQSNSFPQSKLRTPSWVSYQTARKAFYDRPEFVVALDRSSIRKIVG